jgi:hypothetical protein
MMRVLIAASAFASVVACAASEAREGNPELDRRAERFEKNLAEADSGGGPIARWALPRSLAEISGMALTPDERLLVHGDEFGEISELDYRRGVLVKNFLIGERQLRADFEGLARVGDRYFMMTSKGKLHEFAEGGRGEQVAFAEHDTGLGGDCEFEGVAFDSTRNALVLPCKVVKVKELEGHLVLYRWSRDSSATPRAERISVPVAEVTVPHDWGSFHPSDITVDPFTGNYVIVAAQEKGLIVVTPEGKPVYARALGDMHNQVEGIAITKNGVLIISDEVGKDTPAHVTLYRWRVPGT